jgi:hypothetical protein
MERKPADSHSGKMQNSGAREIIRQAGGVRACPWSNHPEHLKSLTPFQSAAPRRTPRRWRVKSRPVTREASWSAGQSTALVVLERRPQVHRSPASCLSVGFKQSKVPAKGRRCRRTWRDKLRESPFESSSRIPIAGKSNSQLGHPTRNPKRRSTAHSKTPARAQRRPVTREASWSAGQSTFLSVL